MQEILLEPYGGQVLGLTVAQTTRLTAIWAFGSLAAFALAAHMLSHGSNAYRLAVYGALTGGFAFIAVIAADPLGSSLLFRFGAMLIGFGGGLFMVGTLTAAMDMAADGGQSGLALGAWGAIQATCYGISIGLGGIIRDVVIVAGPSTVVGLELAGPVLGYDFVYVLEILFLIAALITIIPLAMRKDSGRSRPSSKFGIAEMP